MSSSKLSLPRTEFLLRHCKDVEIYERGTDSVRALGTARANEIISGSITTAYLQWMWVNNLEKQDKSRGKNMFFHRSQNVLLIIVV